MGHLENLSISQLYLLLFVSLDMRSSSRDLFKLLLFRISILAHDTKQEHLLRMYKLGLTCDSNDAFDVETSKLLHSVLFQCQTLIPKFLQKFWHSDLKVILQYYASASPIPIEMNLVELLLLRFCNITADRESIDSELFLELYLRFTEADVPNTTALADNFNIKLLGIVQTDLKTLKTPILPVSGLTQKDPPSDNRERFFIDSISQSSLPIIKAVNYTWAYLKNCYRSGKARFVEKNLAQDMVKAVNGFVGSTHLDRETAQLPGATRRYLAHQAQTSTLSSSDQWHRRVPAARKEIQSGLCSS